MQQRMGVHVPAIGSGRLVGASRFGDIAASGWQGTVMRRLL